MQNHEEITMTEIITRNEGLLRGVVVSFMRKVCPGSRGGMIDHDDMMQEVRLCFIQEVERYGEAVAVTHRRTLFHACYDAVRLALPVKVAYAAYRKDRRQAYVIEEWDGAREDHQQAGRIDAAFGCLAVREALEAMNEQEREIIRLKLEGLTQHEIGLKMGLSDVQMCRAMKRIRRHFEQEQ